MSAPKRIHPNFGYELDEGEEPIIWDPETLKIAEEFCQQFNSSNKNSNTISNTNSNQNINQNTINTNKNLQTE